MSAVSSVLRNCVICCCDVNRYAPVFDVVRYGDGNVLAARFLRVCRIIDQVGEGQNNKRRNENGPSEEEACCEEEGRGEKEARRQEEGCSEEARSEESCGKEEARRQEKGCSKEEACSEESCGKEEARRQEKGRSEEEACCEEGCGKEETRSEEEAHRQAKACREEITRQFCALRETETAQFLKRNTSLRPINRWGAEKRLSCGCNAASNSGAVAQ